MNFTASSLSVYLVIGSQNVNGCPSEVVRIVDEACQAGVTAVQYREKDQSTLNQVEKVDLGQKIRAITAAAHVPLYVDDDLALALAIKADGIHVGQGDVSVQAIHQVAPNLLLGLSVHDLKELKLSQEDLAVVDYIGVGPVFVTKSKDQVKTAIGPEGLRTVARHSPVPVVAIGGIHVNNKKQLANLPIAGVAVIAAITASNDIATSVQQLKGVSQ